MMAFDGTTGYRRPDKEYNDEDQPGANFQPDEYANTIQPTHHTRPNYRDPKDSTQAFIGKNAVVTSAEISLSPMTI